MASTNDVWMNARVNGVLRRKKEKHAFLEDPWKSQFMCWITERSLFVQPVEVWSVKARGEVVDKFNLTGAAEIFPLDEWEISDEAKDRKPQKFTIRSRDGGAKMSFKAETEAEVEEKWLVEIRKVIESEPPPKPDPKAAEPNKPDDATLKLNGHHVFNYPNGDRYDGEWSNGKKHGSGKYVRADGSIYQGDYVNDNKQGKGTCKWPNGNVYTGR